MAATQHANRKPASKRFSVGDQISPDTEILLGAAEGQPEADEDLVEDQRDPALGAHRAQSPQPCV